MKALSCWLDRAWIGPVRPGIKLAGVDLLDVDALVVDDDVVLDDDGPGDEVVISREGFNSKLPWTFSGIAGLTRAPWASDAL